MVAQASASAKRGDNTGAPAALPETAAIADDLRVRLQTHCSDEPLMEVVMLTGLYHAVNFVVNGFALEHEPFAPRFADSATRYFPRVGEPAMLTAAAALERLQVGNRRFVADRRADSAITDSARRRELTGGQQPFAIILGCSDSRVPAELVFDQGLGDLFVIRVAGNIVAPSLVGSVEFAAAQFGTPLVVVMGHTQCGAIQATLQQLRTPAAEQSRNLRAIVDRIRPSVESLLADPGERDEEALVQAAVRANIRASARQLRQGSQILESLVADGALTIVAAEYSLETGVVEFLDEPAPSL